MQQRPGQYLVVGAILLLCGCSHLRPPDEYGWIDKTGDPGRLDHAMATSWEMQQQLNDNVNAKLNREMKNASPLR